MNDIQLFSKLQWQNIVNFQFLTLFQTRFGASPLSILEQIKTFTKTKKNQNQHPFILNFQNQINQILDFLKIPLISLQHLTGEITPTQVNRIITTLILPNSLIRKKIEQMRSHLLNQLKHKDEICEEDFNLLYGIYKFIFIGKETIDTKNLKRDPERKILKTILISLKKMMIVGNDKTHKKKIKKIDPYHINLDVKNILFICQKKLGCNKYPELAEKLKNIRLSEKKNKWIGPRLWKILQKNKWSSNEILVLMRFIKLSAKYLEDIKSSPECLEKMVKKILFNLQGLIDILSTKNTFDNQKSNNSGISIHHEITDQKKPMINEHNPQNDLDQLVQQLNYSPSINFQIKRFQFQDIENFEQKIIKSQHQNIFQMNELWI